MYIKGINLGSKQTGKIAAGIAFFNNLTQETDTLGGGNTWVRIGNQNPNHPLFILIPIQPVSNPSSSDINDYFQLLPTVNPQTQIQSLTYQYGKQSILYCSYSLSLFQTQAGPPVSPVTFSARVSSSDVNGVTTVISQSVRTFRYSGSSSPVEHVFPMVCPSKQNFYLEINRLDAQANAAIIVREAILSIYE